MDQILTTLPALPSLKQAESRAVLLGDFIFPRNALLNPYLTWAH